jgi:lipopolysaccharide export system ATP-binding protein
MTSGSERDYRAGTSDWGSTPSAGKAPSPVGVTGWLRALLGRKAPVPTEHAPNPEAWLFESSEGAEAQEALGPDWLPQDLETWDPKLAAPAASALDQPVSSTAESKPRQPSSHPANGAEMPKATRQSPSREGEPSGPAHQNGSLIVQSLHKSFKKRQIIKDVSLMLQRGEAVGLLWPNGAGKTTLFYMITGLIRPDSGTIMLDDYDVTTLPMYRRARLGIGYLPQEPSIFRGLSVENNIRAVLEITQPDKKKRAEELEALLDEFDIARLRKLPAIALSGGERRRCEIARSLAGHPSFMLLDEPFAGIDPIAIGDIRQLVMHLKNRGIGVLITDHNVRETLDLIDRAYIVHGGGILTEGAPDEIVANPDVRRFYLGESFRL